MHQACSGDCVHSIALSLGPHDTVCISESLRLVFSAGGVEQLTMAGLQERSIRIVPWLWEHEPSCNLEILLLTAQVALLSSRLPLKLRAAPRSSCKTSPKFFARGAFSAVGAGAGGAAKVAGLGCACLSAFEGLRLPGQAVSQDEILQRRLCLCIFLQICVYLCIFVLAPCSLCHS